MARTKCLLAIMAIAVFVGCGCISDSNRDLNRSAKPSDSDLVFIRGEIRAWVDANNIHRYAWDDPALLLTAVTREELCRQLLATHNAFENACDVSLSDCLRALAHPVTLDEAELNRWSGAHRDFNRDQQNPDDAVWHRARWVRDGGYWQQDVVWAGAAPRRGWNRADADGLWGWDPKLPGDFEGDIDDDGQGGWRGLHVGYPFQTDEGCDCILWVTSKEAYLECLTADGIRTGAGLGHRYRWRVEQH